MASNAQRFIVLSDGDGYSGIEGAAYIEVSSPDVLADEAAGVYENARDFSGEADLIVPIEKIIAVVENAIAVLDSINSAFAMHRLARAVEDAGFATEGIYTSLYTGEEPSDD